MEKRTISMPLKPMPIETRLAFSMLFQVKDKLVFEKWMVAREIVSANKYLFTRIATAIERDYHLVATPEHLYEALNMLLAGLKIQLVQRPR